MSTLPLVVASFSLNGTFLALQDWSSQQILLCKDLPSQGAAAVRVGVEYHISVSPSRVGSVSGRGGRVGSRLRTRLVHSNLHAKSAGLSTSHCNHLILIEFSMELSFFFDYGVTHILTCVVVFSVHLRIDKTRDYTNI